VSTVSGALHSPQWQQNFHRVDERGQRRLCGGGELISDVLLTGVVVVSTVGDVAENPDFDYREPLLEVGWV
jgi:hypothetical protein